MSVAQTPRTPTKSAPGTPAPARNEEGGIGGWLQWVFTPGIGNGVINFARFTLLLVILFLGFMVTFHYNIHWMMMTIIAICLTLSFEFTVNELRKNPEVMDPSKNKPKNE